MSLLHDFFVFDIKDNTPPQCCQETTKPCSLVRKEQGFALFGIIRKRKKENNIVTP